MEITVTGEETQGKKEIVYTRAGFFSLSAAEILSQILLCCEGLSWALLGVKQHYQPLPTGCQSHLPTLVATTENTSRHCQMCPGWQTKLLVENLSLH